MFRMFALFEKFSFLKKTVRLNNFFRQRFQAFQTKTLGRQELGRRLVELEIEREFGFDMI